MKSCAAILLLAAIACSALADMSTPLTSLGNANALGKFQIWIDADNADYGNGVVLPVRITFESGDGYQSKILGRGFWFPLLEARAYPYNERLMQVELLCGKTIFLRKDLKNAGQYYTASKKITGTLDGNKFTLQQDDGWILRYKDGKIWQAQTDQGRILTWYYRNGQATEIKEERSGNSAVKLEYGANGRVNGVNVNGRLHGLELGKKPRVEVIDNKKVVGAMDESLGVWAYPDGKKDTYEFSVTKELEPMLTRTDKDGTRKTYQWDARSGFIVSDDAWRYKIERNGQLPKLRRYNDQGQEEFRIVDNRNGIVEQKTVEKGSRITETFKTPGPLYGKVRKIEAILPDGTKKNIYQAAYDDKGRLIRKIDEKGFTYRYKYGSGDKIISRVVDRPSNPYILSGLKSEEKTLLSAIASAEDDASRGDAQQQLGFFYIHQMGDIDKALALIPQMKKRRQIFNIKLQAVFGNLNMPRAQKVAQFNALLEEYPESKSILEFLIKTIPDEKRELLSVN